MNSVDIRLGSRAELYYLFPFTPKSTLNLSDVITFCICQTLQRDMFLGSWADVYFEKDQYCVKITCPNPRDDVSAYATLIPGHLKAATKAFELYRQHEQEILNVGNLSFMIPFGLAMARTKSLMLLHYPPNTTLDFMDYLYSKTNRRWQCLLWNNGAKGDQTRLQSIIDAVPLAAGGGDSTGIAPFNSVFFPYREMILENQLKTDGGESTMPAVAYGAPVRQGLQKDYPDQLKREPDVLDLYRLKLTSRKETTPVLFANHPSEFLYLNSKTPLEQRMTVVRQDLIAAGWQIRMGEDWNADPVKTLDEVKDHWAEDSKVAAILKEQELEFGNISEYWKPNAVLAHTEGARAATHYPGPSGS